MGSHVAFSDTVGVGSVMKWDSNAGLQYEEHKLVGCSPYCTFYMLHYLSLRF